MLHSSQVSQQSKYLDRLNDFINTVTESEKWKVVQYCVHESVKSLSSSSTDLITNEIKNFFGQVICMYTGTVENLNYILYGGELDSKVQTYQIGPYAVLLDGIIRYKCENPCTDKEVYRRTSSEFVSMETIFRHITTQKIAYWSGFTSTYKSEGQLNVNDQIKTKELKYDLLFIINTEKTALKACYIEDYSMYVGQHECLYPPATPV